MVSAYVSLIADNSTISIESRKLAFQEDRAHYEAALLPNVRKRRHREPAQCGRLKYNAKTECGLIGYDWIMSALRRPLPDDKTNSVLNHKCAAEMCEVQCTIGACGDFDGKVIRYDRR